jgi:AraC-like DNA-binding protein
MVMKRFFLVAYLCGFMVYAQTNESEKLLAQAEEVILSNPKEAQTISTYIFKQTDDSQIIAKSIYISALSDYVMGKYDLALQDAFSSKNFQKNSSENQEKSDELIREILDDLGLKIYPIRIPSEQKSRVFQGVDYYSKGISALNNHQLDSAQYFDRQIPIKSTTFDFISAQKALLKGEIFFEKKELDSSTYYFQKVLDFAGKIENPFMELQARNKLARNYLAMDSLEKFQEQSQKTKELGILTHKIENNAANLAHKLLVKDWDEDLNRSEQSLWNWIWVLLGLMGILIVIGLILHFRNKSKIKTYKMLLNYLQKKEEAMAKPLVLEEILEEQEEIIEQKSKPIQILKESELQILQGLEKFEASAKFTNKDMSLGLLAAQLNTNTKYLSEIINRQKNKNFNGYINELRINYITEKLSTNPQYLNYKVSYLAEECGFSSHSTFTTVFKSIVGVSPAVFMDFIRDEKKSSKLELEDAHL